MPRRGACRVCATERTRSVRNIRQPSCLINGIRVYHSARLGPHATAWCDRRIPYSAPSLLIDSRSGTRTYSCTRGTRTVSLPGGRLMFLFFLFRLVFLRFSLVLWKIISPFNCLSHKHVRGFPWSIYVFIFSVSSRIFTIFFGSLENNFAIQLLIAWTCSRISVLFDLVDRKSKETLIQSKKQYRRTILYVAISPHFGNRIVTTEYYVVLTLLLYGLRDHYH